MIMLQSITFGEYLHEKIMSAGFAEDYGINGSDIIAIYNSIVDPDHLVTKFRFEDLCGCTSRLASDGDIKYSFKTIRDIRPEDGINDPSIAKIVILDDCPDEKLSHLKGDSFAIN